MRFHRPTPHAGRPRVSVVIPCYNYGHFLPQAVSSVLEQDGVDVDVVIVDDASPDGSVEVAEALAASDRRISVVAHEVNRGHIATYNDGLARVQGDYVVLLSADDVLMPGSLRRSTGLMEAHPDVVMVYGYAAEFDTEPPPASSVREWWSTWSGEEWIRVVCSRGRNIIVNPEVVLRTTVMRDIGGYGAEHPHAADMEVWLRAAVRGSVARVNGPLQAAYRVHGDNMHMTTFGDLIVDLEAVRAVYEAFLGAAGDGGGLHDARRLLQRSRRALAREAVLATAQRDVGSDEREALIALARQTHPSVARTPAWLVTQSRSASRPQWHDNALARVEELRWSMRSHRWRRLGT